MRVPLIDLASQEASIAEDVVNAIAGVARDAAFVLGVRVEAFEQWLAAHCGSTYAVGVASGTDALELALRALDVGPGDAVVTPALSFVAAAEAIAVVGARPLFCDIDPRTMNASEETVAAALDRGTRQGLRVRAIVPVHLFGRCAPLGPLRRLATEANIALVEDAAQAIGARDGEERRAGSVGDAGCFSFFPTKNLGAWGDGGAIVTSRPDLAMRVRRLRVHGASSPYVHEEVGRNSRLDAVQAAVLLTKAPHLPGFQRARVLAATQYGEALRGLPLILPEPPPTPSVHAWHSYVVRTERRDALALWLRERGIETRIYYPIPLHRQRCFASLDEPPMPAAEEACRTALALPLFTTISDAQQSHVIDTIARFFRDGR